MNISSIIQNAYELPTNFHSLECGANCIEYVETLDWVVGGFGWLMEPIPNIAIDIKNNLTQNNISSDLSNFNGKTNYSVETITGLSHIVDQESKGDSIIEVECITYNKLQDDLGVYFDVLVLDIEGNEEQVLDHWLTLPRKYLPKIMCIECGYDWEKRKKLLSKLGYELNFYFFNNAYLKMKDCGIKLKQDIINNYNEQWPKWNFNGQTIYVNELYKA